MRYLILAPIGAALLSAAAAHAENDAVGCIDAQAYASMPAPVVAPVSPHLLASPAITTAPDTCDACFNGQRLHGNVAIDPPLLPYHPPVLPPPSTLYGYFNSPPEHLHLWDNYPREVALRHWHRAAKERHLKGDRHHRVGGGHPHR